MGNLSVVTKEKNRMYLLKFFQNKQTNESYKCCYYRVNKLKYTSLSNFLSLLNESKYEKKQKQKQNVM
jgi:hypothetical protein